MRLFFGAVVSGLAIAVGATGLWVSSSEAGGGGCHEALTDRATTQVSMTHNCFGPTVARVEVGDTVTWKNDDQQVHNVYSVGMGWGDGRQIDAGASVTAVFDATGVFPYLCTLHPGMGGVVVVGDGTASAAAFGPASGPEAAMQYETESPAGSAPRTSASASAGEGDGGVTLAIAGLVAGVASAVGLTVAGVAAVRRR